ncbi:hypothetical protein AB3S75_025389 [Citrus x aurantiifolia]
MVPGNGQGRLGSGTGRFSWHSQNRTINEALTALTRMGRTRPQRVVIYVKSGVYDEKVEIARHMNNIMFVGDGIDIYIE